MVCAICKSFYITNKLNTKYPNCEDKIQESFEKVVDSE